MSSEKEVSIPIENKNEQKQQEEEQQQEQQQEEESSPSTGMLVLIILVLYTAEQFTFGSTIRSFTMNIIHFCAFVVIPATLYIRLRYFTNGNQQASQQQPLLLRGLLYADILLLLFDWLNFIQNKYVPVYVRKHHEILFWVLSDFLLHLPIAYYIRTFLMSYKTPHFCGYDKNNKTIITITTITTTTAPEENNNNSEKEQLGAQQHLECNEDNCLDTYVRTTCEGKLRLFIHFLLVCVSSFVVHQYLKLPNNKHAVKSTLMYMTLVHVLPGICFYGFWRFCIQKTKVSAASLEKS